ncbi:MAG: hypothetical protein ACFNZS_01825 [Ottowia sp.]
MHQRASWNPARRNRRTGTAASGYKRRAPFAIPAPFGRQREPRAFHEQLHSPVIVWRQVAGHSLCFAVEPPHLPGGFFHPCTVDDLCAVLAGCPPHDVARVRTIVLRQPTRKQRIFSRAWGRALFVRHGAPVIVLEAQSLASWRWPLALTPEWARELARLRADGHTAQRNRRHWLVTPSPDALRCTLLWRTLLHELGHIVDHARCLSGKGQEVWKTRCSSAKEDFAHRYAQERMAALQASGQAPFPAKKRFLPSAGRWLAA